MKNEKLILEALAKILSGQLLNAFDRNTEDLLLRLERAKLGGAGVTVNHQGETKSSIVQIYKCGECREYFHTVDHRKYAFCPGCGGRIL